MKSLTSALPFAPSSLPLVTCSPDAPQCCCLPQGGWIGFWGAIAGIPGGICLSMLADRMHGRKKVRTHPSTYRPTQPPPSHRSISPSHPSTVPSVSPSHPSTNPSIIHATSTHPSTTSPAKYPCLSVKSSISPRHQVAIHPPRRLSSCSAVPSPPPPSLPLP